MNSNLLEDLCKFCAENNLTVVRCSIQEDCQTGTAIVEGNNHVSSLEWKNGSWSKGEYKWRCQIVLLNK